MRSSSSNSTSEILFSAYEQILLLWMNITVRIIAGVVLVIVVLAAIGIPIGVVLSKGKDDANSSSQLIESIDFFFQ